MYKKITATQVENALYPLAWYIQTSRAGADFLRRLYDIKPYVVGRLLINANREHKTTDETVEIIKSRVNKGADAEHAEYMPRLTTDDMNAGSWYE
jgi:hypothetical protein